MSFHVRQYFTKPNGKSYGMRICIGNNSDGPNRLELFVNDHNCLDVFVTVGGKTETLTLTPEETKVFGETISDLISTANTRINDCNICNRENCQEDHSFDLSY